MTILLNAAIVLTSFFLMEFVAWFTHKFIMHGFLWVLHKDHHTREHPLIEWNDIFVLIFALPSILLIIFGFANFDFRFWIGIGIALYGLCYFLFHDVLVHRRLSILDNIDNRYFRSIVRAHNDHHLGGENFGFILMIPWRYFEKDDAVSQRGKY